MKRVRISFWILLYAAFVAWGFGFAAQMQAKAAAEFWGWDYATFVRQLGDWSWIGYFGFRHPGLGIVYSPLVALQHGWASSYILVLAGIATGTAALIWRMSGWIGLVVWLAMPTTWYMAAIPESFPIAQLGLVASAYYFSRREENQKWDWVVSLGLAGVNSMVTLTNGLKPLLAGIVNIGTWRQKLRVLGGVVLCGVMVAGLFYVRTLVTGRGCSAGIAMTLSWIPEERHWLQEAYGFFVRPVGVWQSVVIYPLAAYSIGRMIVKRDYCWLRILLPMFAVDLGVHWVIGWGMAEPWVFAPHWVWMLPVLIGRGVRR